VDKARELLERRGIGKNGDASNPRVNAITGGLDPIYQKEKGKGKGEKPGSKKMPAVKRARVILLGNRGRRMERGCPGRS